MFRRRLHKSSIVIGLLVALLLMLLNIPGRLVDHQTSTGNTFEHGWPFVYLRRLTDEPGTVVEYLGKPISVACAPVWLTRRDAVQYLPMWGIPWLSAVNWQFWEADVQEGITYRDLRTPTLVLDLGIAIFVLLSAIAAWEVRRRRRPRLLCFTLFDMIVAMSVVSIFLAVLVHLNREYHRESRLGDEKSVDSDWSVHEHKCIAPLWVRSLVGERLLPGFVWRPQVFWITSDYVTDASAVCDQLSQFDYLTRVEVTVEDTSPRKPFQFSALGKLERLICIDTSFYDALDEHDVDEITQLKSLRKLVLWKDEVDPELLSRIRIELPACTIVDGYDDW